MHTYVLIFERHLVNLVEQMSVLNYIFQQDTASIHSAKVTKKWLEENKITAHE